MTCMDALQGRSNVARGQEPEATALMSRELTCREALMSRAQDAQERPADVQGGTNVAGAGCAGATRKAGATPGFKAEGLL